LENRGHIKAGVELWLAGFGFLFLNKKIFGNENSSFSSRVHTVEIAMGLLFYVAIDFLSFSFL